MPGKQESAETLALQALAWLAENDDLLPVFLDASGASVADLAAGASDPVFLGAVLDFLMNDDVWVVGFCDATGHSYDAPMRARAELGGGLPHWT
ncbi:MAG: DUF3572 domain-containing protein [Cereibacter sphaeroides]|uniref:DUF3572 domain-containing protein n=1 Tax=Cereibacter sphaeroides TaxID=1063 RepID=A0A2W5SHC9_CERSP|nr:MAG: DUF3572 domain-containing protein [Cereibacter sphaeroides]